MSSYTWSQKDKGVGLLWEWHTYFSYGHLCNKISKWQWIYISVLDKIRIIFQSSQNMKTKFSCGSTNNLYFFFCPNIKIENVPWIFVSVHTQQNHEGAHSKCIFHFCHNGSLLGTYFHPNNPELEVAGVAQQLAHDQAAHFPKHFGFQNKREISQGELVSAS